MLPKRIQHTNVPPIKCQGIKTKLVAFIAENILWEGRGKWVEPFLGSGVVAFNIAPERALLTDSNIHLVNFYNDVQSGKINAKIVKEYLVENGQLLLEQGEKFYYRIREEFNANPDSLKFIFLNRASYNGLMRFNSKGLYNVPFGRKRERFRQGYITKIVNQLSWVERLIKNSDWSFESTDFTSVLKRVSEDDFVYLDPPYIGRHADYYSSWSEDQATELARVTNRLPCGFALSMWKENRYRKNDHINKYWKDSVIKTFDHFYHIGSSEKLRNAMTEALIIKKGYAKGQGNVQETMQVMNSMISDQ